MGGGIEERSGADPLFADSAAETKIRYLALDGLRGVAAISVVLYHFRWTNHFTANAFFKHTYLAVDLFFILSGFIIYAGYSGKLSDRSSLQRFIYLRFFRVYPLHLAVLLAFLALEVAKLWAQRSGALIPEHEPFTEGNSIAALIANIFLVHGLGIFDHLSWNTPSWSISCEFVAYMVFGTGALAGLFRSKLVSVFGAVLAVVGYTAIALAYGTLDITYDWGLVRCLSGFFFGMLIFEAVAGPIGDRLRAQSTTLIGCCEVGLLVALMLAMVFASGAAIVLVIPIFIGSVIVLQLDRGPIAKALQSKTSQFLGRISYSIYMIHFFIIVVLFVVLKRIVGVQTVLDPLTQVPSILINPWIGDMLVVIVLLFVVAMSAVTYTIIEQPARLFGRRLATSSFRRAGSLPAMTNSQH